MIVNPGSQTDIQTPTLVDSGSTWRYVGNGLRSGCGIRENETRVECWGGDAFDVYDSGPESISTTMDGGGLPLMLIAALIIIIVVLSAVAGVFGLFYRGYGGWRTDGQVPPHAIMEDPTRRVPDQRTIYHPADWERRPPLGPPP